MSTVMRVLHLDSNHDILAKGLSKLGCTNVFDFKSNKEDIMANIENHDAIVIRSRFPIDKAFLDTAQHLRFIARVGSGLENIDVAYANTLGIEIISSPEGNANAVGNHALAMLLALLNNLPKGAHDIANGNWEREGNRGEELDGKTIGLIGYGHTGSHFAKKLQGFDVKVLCHDILPNKGDENATQVSLAFLQAQADIVSLHLPQTPETKAYINTDFINQMSKPFWLINTSRGNQVVIDDLLRAMENKTILGAGLDVLPFEKSSFEQLDHNPQLQQLIDNPLVLLSPHIAGWTHQSKERLAQVIVDKVKIRFFTSS
jgi:D-3-phosphoglycerate dehydrogenase